MGDHSQISSTELGQLVQVPEDEVRRKMHFWSRMGVVIELSSGSTINSSSGTGDSSSRLISPRAHSTESVMYRSVDSPHEGAFKLGSVLNEMEIVSEQQFEDEDSMASGSMNEESHSKEYLDTLEKYVIGM